MASRMRPRTTLTILLLAVVLFTLYARRLAEVPPYLHHDEIFFATQAVSIAATAHDTNGRLLPPFFEVYSGGTWFLPAVVYFTALFLKVMPLSEATLRFPTVIVALMNVLLVYAVARRIWRSGPWAVVAALLM